MFPYDDRIVREDSGRMYVDYSETRKRNANASLIKRFEREASSDRHGFRTHFGTLLSGGARIFSARFRDELVASIPAGNVVGGEMEAVGLMSAAPADRPLWAVVKGISDFADGDRDGIIEQTRPIACRNAATFVLSALQHTTSP